MNLVATSHHSVDNFTIAKRSNFVDFKESIQLNVSSVWFGRTSLGSPVG